MHHGCSSYNNDEGTKVGIDINYYTPLIIFQTFLVTGGYTGSPDYDYLSSTELLVETWSRIKELATRGHTQVWPKAGVRGLRLRYRRIPARKYAGEDRC